MYNLGGNISSIFGCKIDSLLSLPNVYLFLLELGSVHAAAPSPWHNMLIVESIPAFWVLIFLLHLTSPVQVFVDHPSYHRPGNLYGDNFGAFGDNQVFLH